MSQTQNTVTPPADPKANEGTKPPVELTQGNGKPAEGTKPVDAKPGQEYVTAFGAQGAMWFYEGKPFADCVAQFNSDREKRHTDTITALKSSHEAEVTSLKAQITELQTKLSAAPRGNDPASFSAEKTPADAKAARFKNLPENTAKFAAGIRFAGQPKEEAAA